LLDEYIPDRHAEKPFLSVKSRPGRCHPRSAQDAAGFSGEFRYEHGHLQTIQIGIFNMTLIRYDDIDMIMIFIDMI
jgi:hypothetical protein